MAAIFSAEGQAFGSASDALEEYLRQYEARSGVNLLRKSYRDWDAIPKQSPDPDNQNASLLDRIAASSSPSLAPFRLQKMVKRAVTAPKEKESPVDEKSYEELFADLRHLRRASEGLWELNDVSVTEVSSCTASCDGPSSPQESDITEDHLASDSDNSLPSFSEHSLPSFLKEPLSSSDDPLITFSAKNAPSVSPKPRFSFPDKCLSSLSSQLELPSIEKLDYLFSNGAMSYSGDLRSPRSDSCSSYRYERTLTPVEDLAASSVLSPLTLPSGRGVDTPTESLPLSSPALSSLPSSPSSLSSDLPLSLRRLLREHRSASSRPPSSLAASTARLNGPKLLSAEEKRRIGTRITEIDAYPIELLSRKLW